MSKNEAKPNRRNDEDRKAKAPRPVRHAEVTRVDQIAPEMVRITFTGDDLGDLALEFTDHYIKILFPPVGVQYAAPFDPAVIKAERPKEEWPVSRTYTIRSANPERQEMVIDFVTHGDTGLAGPWAAQAKPGEMISFNGPGGAWGPGKDARQILLVGDEAAIPAIAAALEKVPEQAQVVSYLEVIDQDHEISDVPAVGTVHWVHRGNEIPGRVLADRVLAADLQIEHDGFEAFVHGNANMVRQIRRWLFKEQKVAKSQVSISGYWRDGWTEDVWQVSKKEFNAEMERDLS